MYMQLSAVPFNDLSEEQAQTIERLCNLRKDNGNGLAICLRNGSDWSQVSEVDFHDMIDLTQVSEVSDAFDTDGYIILDEDLAPVEAFAEIAHSLGAVSRRDDDYSIYEIT